MKRLIIYDLDGTLVDTRKDIAESVCHMLRMLELPALSDQEIYRCVGHGLRHLVAACLKTQDAKQIDQAMRIYRAYYGEHLADHSGLYPGVVAVLEHFSKRSQVVFTNKPNPFSHELLKRLGVADYFTEIIAGDSMYPRKPDPTAVLSLMDRDGVGPDQALMIGDSPIDVETGQQAGVLTVGVAHGFIGKSELAEANPDVLVHDMAELLEFARIQGW